MAELLGAVAEEQEGNEENILELDGQRELEAAPETEAETEHRDVPHFVQSENHFQGQAQTNEYGKVVDYRYAGGLISAAAEGAVLEKILSLYQEVLDRGVVVKKIPDPENGSITIVQKFERGDGHNMIDIWITRERTVSVQAAPEKKFGAPSPAELEAANVEKFLALTTTPTEVPHVEAVYVEHAERVTSIETARVVHAARMNGITLEGVPVAHVTSPVHTVSLEDAAELNGQRGAAPAEAESSVHSRELEALRFLRAA